MRTTITLRKGHFRGLCRVAAGAAVGAVLLSTVQLVAPVAHAQVSSVGETPLQTLERRAEAGDSLASYRLGQMYAAGQGAEKSNLTALIWLNCAAGDDRAGDVKSDSLRTRSEIEEQAGQVISFLGRLLARVRCSGSSWTTPYNPEREKVQDKVFFFPGDMTIVAALNLSHVFSFSWLTDMILAGYRNMGSVLVGTISLLVWALSIKGLIVAATAIDTSSNSWMRKPTGVSNPHQPKKKNPKGKKRKQKEKQPQPAGE